MKKMKKLLAMSLVLTMGLQLAACGGSKEEPKGEAKAEGAQEAAAPAGETYELKFAHIFPGNGNEQKWFDYAKEEIEKQSEGHVIINIYPDGTLGSESELTPQVLAGTLDMSFSGPSVWGDAINLPELGWSEMPYLVTNYDDMNKLGMALPELTNQQLETAGMDLYCLGAMSQGLRCVMNTKKEITSLADMAGMKCRVPESAMYVNTVESFGASATVMSSSELYSALQQGVVEAYENDPATAVARNLHEVLKYYSTTNHIASLNLLLVNKSNLEELPEEYRNIVKDVFADACAQQLEDRVIENNKLIDTMAESGMVVTDLTDEQRQEFVDSVKPMKEEYIAENGLEDIMAQLEEILAQ